MIEISIVTVVLDNYIGIAKTLDSIYAQKHCSIDHIVIDGKSSDGTLEKIKELARPITRVFSDSDNGIYDAMNKGLSHVRGDVVGFLNAGDCYRNEFILSRISDVYEETSADVIYGDLMFLDKMGNPARYWRSGYFDERRIPLGWIPPHPAVYAKTDLFSRVGGFDPSFRNAGDYEWLLRAIRGAGVEPQYVPEIFVNMELGGVSNGSAGGVWLGMKEVRRAWRRNGYSGGVLAPPMKFLSKLPQYFRRSPNVASRSLAERVI